MRTARIEAMPTAMHLELEFGSTFCYTPKFKINGISADSKEFGEKGDEAPEDAEEYGCGDMKFTRRESSPELLKKYSITQADYDAIAEKLESGLSFGACGWCV